MQQVLSISPHYWAVESDCWASGSDSKQDQISCAPAENPRRACYIVVGNHRSYVGIVEMIEMLHSFFKRHFPTFVSTYMVPGAINVIIDEFSHPGMAERVRQQKDIHPDTRIILMATEFITRIRVAGADLGNTFNVFDAREAWKTAARLLACQLGVRPTKPYYVARYRGFIDVLPAVDLVLCAHQAVADTMSLLPDMIRRKMRPPLTIYPRFDLNRLINDTRLYERPTGVVMTGTRTKYRQQALKGLTQNFAHAGHDLPTCWIPFNAASGPRFSKAAVNLNYDLDPEGPVGSGPLHYLFNFNPPQCFEWAFSSPMRIQRAILKGQIPLICRKYNDHGIETTAMLWDGTKEFADGLWSDATIGRHEMIKQYIATIARYNDIADQNNATIDKAVREII